MLHFLTINLFIAAFLKATYFEKPVIVLDVLVLKKYIASWIIHDTPPTDLSVCFYLVLLSAWYHIGRLYILL